jgi:hypothetical protein
VFPGRHPRRGDPAVVVTTAAISPEQELAARERRYIITMVIRTICFALAVLLPVPLVWKLPAVIAAIVLPWLAVTAANVGPARQPGEQLAEVAPRPAAEEPPAKLAGPVVIDMTEDSTGPAESQDSRSGR